MFIEGYVHRTEDDAFLASVEVVEDMGAYDATEVGYMELTDGDNVRVGWNPAYGLVGQIVA